MTPLSHSLEDRNTTDPDPVQSGTLAPILGAAAERDPGHTALVYGRDRVGYGELTERVACLAHGLAARGLGPHDPVALVMRDGPEFVIGFLAIASLRAVAVPLDPRAKASELRFCLRECGVRGVLADPDQAARCRALAPDDAVDVIAGLGSTAGGHPPAELGRAEPEDEVVFQYSAGCTGGPKRVPRTQGQVRAEADSLVATLGLTPADVVFSTLPLFHSYGLGTCMLAALRSGATLVILEDAHPFVLQRDNALEVLERERATVFPAVPFIFRLLAEAPRGGDLSTLRLCLSAASALPRPTFEAFSRRYGVPIRQLYGSTETGAVCVNLDDDPWTTWRSVGRPLDGVEVQVLDESGEPVDDGRIGEIAVRSPGMSRGYAGLPDVNREQFADGWFVSNDRGRLDESGRLHIVGRKQLLIDVKGDKLDPVEVEDVLAVHPKVREVVVVGTESGAEGEDLVKAVVVPDGPCEARELIRFARERLSNYKVPQLVEFRDEIPKTASGDVLRKYLV